MEYKEQINEQKIINKPNFEKGDTVLFSFCNSWVHGYIVNYQQNEEYDEIKYNSYTVFELYGNYFEEKKYFICLQNDKNTKKIYVKYLLTERKSKLTEHLNHSIYD